MNMATGLQAANTKFFSVRNSTYLHVLYMKSTDKEECIFSIRRSKGKSGGLFWWVRTPYPLEKSKFLNLYNKIIKNMPRIPTLAYLINISFRNPLSPIGKKYWILVCAVP